MASNDDPKVKELLENRAPVDPATQRELERWFGLPSVTQLEEEGKLVEPPVDAEMAAVIARRDKALAEIDPNMLAALAARADRLSQNIGVFQASLDVTVDPAVAQFDETMVDRAMTIAEPREYELPDQLADDLKECTPQALLRDLHRPEKDFDKTFEIVDPAEEQRLDIVAEVKAAMSTSWKLPAFERSAVAESRELYDGVRTQRRQRWTEFLPHLPNRTVQE